MSVNSRLLIEQIEARPALWNRDDKDYCQKPIISKLWAEIALTHGVHESKVRSRWKALRDTFRHELKKNARRSSWCYYRDMLFLKGQLKRLPPQRSQVGFDESEELGDVTLVKTEPEDGGSRSLEEDQEEGEKGLASMKETDSVHDCCMTDDDDLHFLLSLLPEMRRLQPKQKLPLRIKIMESIYEEAYHHQSD